MKGEYQDVLITYTGFPDPYFKGLIDKEEQPGPIISLLNHKQFTQIFLVDTPSTEEKKKTRESIQQLLQKPSYNSSDCH